MKRPVILGALVAALLAAQVVSPASACGCGGAAPEPGTEVSVDRETALVSWSGGLEQIVMKLDMRSDADTTGLVVPTPSPATVTAGDPALFTALEAATAPIVTTEYDWWGPGIVMGGAAGAPDGGAPVVLDRVQIGPIEAVTLAASDAAGLQAWLDENGFALSDALLAELGPYVDDGWSFVALKLTADAAFDGELDPITFTFASDELVYPIRMSRAATTPQNVRLYVLDDRRAGIASDEATTYWAGPVDDPRLTALGDFLTVIDLSYSDPANQINHDLTIGESADDRAQPIIVTNTEYVTVLGFIPLGPFLVVIVLLFVVVGGSVGLAVSLSRRANR